MNKSNKYFDSIHNFNIELYKSCDEWIDFYKGEEVFGRSSKCLRESIKSFGLGHKSESINGARKTLLFNKKEYLSVYFLTENECIKHYNLPLIIISEMAKCGHIVTLKIDNTTMYEKRFSKEFTQKYKMKSEMNNKFISLEDAYKLVKKDFVQYNEFLIDVFQNADKYKLKLKIKENNWYIHSEAVGVKITKVKRKYNIKRSHFHLDLHAAYKLVKDKFDSYQKFYFEVINNKEKFNLVEMKNDIYINMSKFYFTKEMVAEKLGVSYKVINKYIEAGFLETVSVKNLKLIKSIEGKTRLEWQEFLANKQANTLPNIPTASFKNVNELVEYYYNWIDANTTYKETLDLTFSYIRQYTLQNAKANSRYKNESIRSRINSAWRLISSLDKEIWNYSNNELVLLFNSALHTEKDAIIFKTILTYIMDKCRKCKYDSIPSALSERGGRKKTKIEKKRYSMEIVEKYFYYLSDIERHFYKAIESDKYAQLWLIGIVYCSEAWRCSDILKLPKPDIEIINILEFKDLHNREITIGDMNLIVENIKAKLYGTVATKNGADIAFVKDLDLILQTGLVLTICELHRRKNNKDVLIYRFENRNPAKNDWNTFYQDKDLKDFKGLMANRSFLNDIYKYAVETPGLAPLAYGIASKFRSHITDGIDESETTQIYLEISKYDGFQDKILYNVQRKGAFGFLYNIITDLVSIEGEVDETKYIEELKTKLSKKSIENLATFLTSPNNELKNIQNSIVQLSDESKEVLKYNISSDIKTYNEYRVKEQITLAKEIIKLSKKELRKKLKNISESSSKYYNCPCIKGINNCDKRSASPEACALCVYSIPTIFTISSLKTNINSLIRKIKETSLNDKVMLLKYKILLMKYFWLIVEANTEFKKYDENLVNSFIDLECIRKEIYHIEKEIFFKAGGLM